MKKIISLVICFTLFFQQSGFCQMLDLSGLITKTQFVPDIRIRPPHLRSFGFEPGSSYIVQVDKGDAEQPKEMKAITRELMKYFLIGLTLPDSAFWVNLRPDSPDNVIDPELARTEIGRIFLEADLELKKDVARYTSPQTDAGRKYWNLLYEKAEQLYGASLDTFPTVTRPWIVPGEIILGDMGSSAFIYKANLNVLLEADYLKNTASSPKFIDDRAVALNEYSSELIKKLIMPLMIKDVNTAKRYASLRQVYYSLILAQWYKEKFKSAQTPFSSRINSRDLSGLTAAKPVDISQYFNAYARSYANGEYSIKETVGTGFGMQVRTYVSGGIKMDGGSFKTTVISSLKKIIFYPFTKIFKGTDQLFMEEIKPEEYAPNPKWASESMAVTLFEQAQRLEQTQYVWPAMTRAEGKELVDFYWRESKRRYNIDWQDLTVSNVKALIEYQYPENLSGMIRVDDIEVLRLLPRKKLVEMALANLIGTKDVAVEFVRQRPVTVAAAGVLGLGLVLAGMHWWDQGHPSNSAVNGTNPVVTQAITQAALSDTAYVTVTPDFSLLAEPTLAALEEKIIETRTTSIPTSAVTPEITSIPNSGASSDAIITAATSAETPKPITIKTTPTPRPLQDQVIVKAGEITYTVGVNATHISAQQFVPGYTWLPQDITIDLNTRVITELPYGEQNAVTYAPNDPGYSQSLTRIEVVIAQALRAGLDNSDLKHKDLSMLAHAQRDIERFSDQFEDLYYAPFSASDGINDYRVLSSYSHISAVTAPNGSVSREYRAIEVENRTIVKIDEQDKVVIYRPGSAKYAAEIDQMISIVNKTIQYKTAFGEYELRDLNDIAKLLEALKTGPKPIVTPTPTPTLTLTPTPTPWVNDQTWSLVTDETGVTSYKIGLNETVISVQKSIMSAKFPVDTSINLGTRVITEIPYTTGELKTVTYQPGSVGYDERLKFIENVISDGLEVGIRDNKFETQAELFNAVQAQRSLDNLIGWIEVSTSMSYYQVMPGTSHISTVMDAAGAHPALYTSLDRSTGVIVRIPYTTGEIKAVAYQPGKQEYTNALQEMSYVVNDELRAGLFVNQLDAQELSKLIAVQNELQKLAGSTFVTYNNGTSHVTVDENYIAYYDSDLYTFMDPLTGAITEIRFNMDTGALEEAGYYEIKDGKKWEAAFNRIDYIFREFSFFSPEKLGGQDKLDLVNSARKIISKFDPNPKPTVTPTPTPWVNDQTWSQITDNSGTHSYKIGLNETVISVQESVQSAKTPLDTSINFWTRVITEVPYTTGELKTVTYQPGSAGYAERLQRIERVISEGLEVGIRDNKFETPDELFNAVQAQRLFDRALSWIGVNYYNVMPGVSHISTVISNVAGSHPPLYTSIDRSTGVIVHIPYTTGKLYAMAYQPGSDGYTWPIEHMLSTVNGAIQQGTDLPADQIQELKDTRAELLKWQGTATLTTPTTTAAPPLTATPTIATPTTAKPTPDVTPGRKRTAVPINAGTSVYESENKDGGKVDDNLVDPNAVGGIDLRMPLPIATIFPAQLLAKVAQLPTSVTDIESELTQIEEYANSGIQPSQERLREFLIACCKKGALKDYSERMLICLAKVLRAEEKDVVATSPELRNLLMIVQAN
jgi:hypothetical protein